MVCCAPVRASVYVFIRGRQRWMSVPLSCPQYRGIAVICSFCTTFNRGALSFHPATPAFVLTNKKRNRRIKSFNYPCEGKAATVCVFACVCVWYNSPRTVSGQRSGCHGNRGWGSEKAGRRGREGKDGGVWEQREKGEIQTFNFGSKDTDASNANTKMELVFINIMKSS